MREVLLGQSLSLEYDGRGPSAVQASITVKRECSMPIVSSFTCFATFSATVVVDSVSNQTGLLSAFLISPNYVAAFLAQVDEVPLKFYKLMLEFLQQFFAKGGPPSQCEALLLHAASHPR